MALDEPRLIEGIAAAILLTAVFGFIYERIGGVGGSQNASPTYQPHGRYPWMHTSFLSAVFRGFIGSYRSGGTRYRTVLYAAELKIKLKR